MRIRELLGEWEDCRHTPKTATEYPVRLSVDDAAQIHALAEMFPGRTEHEIITDLLSAALADLVEAMPYVQGSRVIAEDDHGDPIYEDTGPTPRFMELSRRHRKALLALSREAPQTPGAGPDG